MVVGEGFGSHCWVGLVVCGGGGRLFYVWCTYVPTPREREEYLGTLLWRRVFVRWCVQAVRRGKQDMYYLNSKRDISIQKLNGDFLHAAR